MGPLGLFGQFPRPRTQGSRPIVGTWSSLIGVAYTVPGGQIAEARFGHNELAEILRVELVWNINGAATGNQRAVRGIA
jgi:hypothetical protein